MQKHLSLAELNQISKVQSYVEKINISHLGHWLFADQIAKKTCGAFTRTQNELSSKVNELNGTKTNQYAIHISGFGGGVAETR